MSKRSRFYKNLEKKSQKTLILSSLGIIFILIILFKFGIPFLSNLSFNVEKLTAKNTNNTQGIAEYLSPPILNPLPQATNSASLKVSGQTASGKNVAIYLNGQKTFEERSDSSGEFSLGIRLTEGENLIKAKTLDNGKSSEFSDTISVVFKKGEPKLEIENPPNDAKVSSKEIIVKGKTDEGNRVTINGYWALIEGESFSYALSLNEGENEINVAAEDDAGNKVEKKIKVIYSP